MQEASNAKNPIRENQSDLFGQDFTDEKNELRARIWKPCWINYPAATKLMGELKRIYGPPSCVISGDANSGKTSFVREFVRAIDEVEIKGDTSNQQSVVYIQSPPTADGSGIYSAILRETHAIFAPSWTIARKQDLVLRTLESLKTRVLIVDEMQSMLVGKANQRTVYLNVLKHLSNELQLSIVAVGTPYVVNALQTDQQWGSRFTPAKLPKWSKNTDFGEFLGQIALRAGVKNPETLVGKKAFSIIHTKCNGLTGEAWQFMCKLIERALLDNDGIIKQELIENLDWVPPQERRKASTMDS